MSRDNREIPGTRQILPLGRPETSAEEINEATTEEQPEDEETQRQPPDKENETIQAQVPKEQPAQTQSEKMDDTAKTQKIIMKEMKVVKSIPKELKQLIDSAKDETIIQEKTRRTKTTKSYAESSSDKSDDEICRFRKLSRRKHWNKGSAKRPKSTKATDTTTHPESESSEITIPDSSEEGGMRPTATSAAGGRVDAAAEA